jgi:hypothetical protein
MRERGLASKTIIHHLLSMGTEVSAKVGG